STVKGRAGGEEPEYDLEVTHWDGSKLQFTRRDPRWTQVYTGVVKGRTVSGTFTHSGTPGTSPWTGSRAEVLTYGLAGKAAADRAAWQERTRRQLDHLMMGGNPAPLSRKVHVVRANLPPTPSNRLPPDRDDNPAHWPQKYKRTELRFDYTLPNPYGGAHL